MTRDIAARFNHLYKPILTLPDPIIQDKENVVPGLDGRKMSKSYGNVIPLLESEKILKKSVMKIVTNSLEPGEPKDSSDCTIFSLFKNFVDDPQFNQIDIDDNFTLGQSPKPCQGKIQLSDDNFTSGLCIPFKGLPTWGIKSDNISENRLRIQAPELAESSIHFVKILGPTIDCVGNSSGDQSTFFITE